MLHRFVLSAGMLAVLVGLSRAEPNAAGKSPDPREILRKANEAAGKLESASFLARTEVTGPLAENAPVSEGKVVVADPAEGMNVPRYHVDATVKYKDSVREFAMAFDGKVFTSVDRGAKTYYREEEPSGRAFLTVVGPLIMRELVLADGFRDEVNAQAVEYRGTEKVYDTECHVVHVVYEESVGEGRWYLGVNDHLPRRVDRIVRVPRGTETVYTTRISQLVPNPKLDAGIFVIEQPEGFRLEKLATRPADDPAAAGQELLPVGVEAPDWTLKTPEGEEVSLKGLRGKVVLLDFWATWCGPCKRAMPGLQRLHQKYAGKPVRIIGISVSEPPNAKPAAYMKTNGFTYTLLVNGDSLKDSYRIEGIPALFLIGPDGKILWAATGYSEKHEEEIDKKIAQTLQKLAP